MATKRKKRKCFVIGPIGKEKSSERTKADWLLRFIIQPVLQHDSFKYDVQRADQFPEPGQITHQVIGAVIDADLVIADLTGLNASALYELAIRHMEQSREEPKPVIHIAEADQPLPFDLKDCRTIFYRLNHPDDIDAAKAELQKQVAAVEAPEYEPTNPIITARGYQELARSAKPIEKVLADVIGGLRSLVSRVDRLETPRVQHFAQGLLEGFGSAQELERKKDIEELDELVATVIAARSSSDSPPSSDDEDESS